MRVAPWLPELETSTVSWTAKRWSVAVSLVQVAGKVRSPLAAWEKPPGWAAVVSLAASGWKVQDGDPGTSDTPEGRVSVSRPA